MPDNKNDKRKRFINLSAKSFFDITICPNFLPQTNGNMSLLFNLN